MIRKSVQRFSEKIMLKQKDRAGWRFGDKLSRSRKAIVAPPTRFAVAAAQSSTMWCA